VNIVRNIRVSSAESTSEWVPWKGAV